MSDMTPRPVNDALLRAVMYMIQASLNINNTGDTFENILHKAKVRLYVGLDALAAAPAPPPPVPLPLPAAPLPPWPVAYPPIPLPRPPEPDYKSEYFTLYNNVVLLRQVLGLQGGHAHGAVDMSKLVKDAEAVFERYNELRKQCRALQLAVIPTPRPPDGRPWGLDFNGLVYMINSLSVKP